MMPSDGLLSAVRMFLALIEKLAENAKDPKVKVVLQEILVTDIADELYNYIECGSNPLPGKAPRKYYVVRIELEEVSDDLAVDRISINEVDVGDERWLLTSFEKQEGYRLGSKLNDIYEDDTVVVILGRVVSEEVNPT